MKQILVKGQLISKCLTAMREICQNFDWFLGDLKTPKFHSEINRPLRFVLLIDLMRGEQIRTISYVIDN